MIVQKPGKQLHISYPVLFELNEERFRTPESSKSQGSYRVVRRRLKILFFPQGFIDFCRWFAGFQPSTV